MPLPNYPIRPQPPSQPDAAEEVKRIGAEVIAQAKALRADCANQTLRLVAATEAARQVTAFAEANAQAHQAQRELLLRGWDNAVAVLEQIQQERLQIEEHAAAAAQAAARCTSVPGALPGSTPGALPGAPVLEPAGPTEFGWVYGQLQHVMQLDGSTPMTGTLVITPSSTVRCMTLTHTNGAGATVYFDADNSVSGTWRTVLNLAGKYQIGTDLELNGTPDFWLQNVSTGNTCLTINGTDLVTIGSAASGGGAVLGKSGGKIAFLDGAPVLQQANASQAAITAVSDSNAKSALQAIYNLLHAYNLAPATA